MVLQTSGFWPLSMNIARFVLCLSYTISDIEVFTNDILAMNSPEKEKVLLTKVRQYVACCVSSR